MAVSYLGLDAVGWHVMLDSWWNKVQGILSPYDQTDQVRRSSASFS
jgi:hypothetical protein